MECKQKEEQHSDYKEAVKAEIQASKEGNYNFEGIGKPKSL